MILRILFASVVACGLFAGGCVDEQREWVEDLYLTESAVDHGQRISTEQIEKRLGKPDAIMTLSQFEKGLSKNQPRQNVIIADIHKCRKTSEDKTVWVYDEKMRYSKPLPFPVLFGQDTEFHCAVFMIDGNDTSAGFVVENWKGLRK